MRTALVLGGAGMIGVHLVHWLREKGVRVYVADIRAPQFGFITEPDEFLELDLSDPIQANRTDFDVDWVFQLAADMGGAEFVFTGKNDLNIMTNSVRININVANRRSKGRIFFSSSACIYADRGESHECVEQDAYPAEPDSNYGFEKLFSERLYLSSGKDVRIARYHNIFAPYGTYEGGREKAPAALCRKIALLPSSGELEIIGDGTQQRSFLYIDECIEGTMRLMLSDFTGPVNIGSTEMVTIRELASIIGQIAGKAFWPKFVDGPTGVRGRNSNNRLIFEKLGWVPRECLREGLEKTYRWIEQQVLAAKPLDSRAEAV